MHIYSLSRSLTGLPAVQLAGPSKVGQNCVPFCAKVTTPGSASPVIACKVFFGCKVFWLGPEWIFISKIFLFFGQKLKFRFSGQF